MKQIGLWNRPSCNCYFYIDVTLPFGPFTLIVRFLRGLQPRSKQKWIIICLKNEKLNEIELCSRSDTFCTRPHANANIYDDLVGRAGMNKMRERFSSACQIQWTVAGIDSLDDFDTLEGWDSFETSGSRMAMWIRRASLQKKKNKKFHTYKYDEHSSRIL